MTLIPRPYQLAAIEAVRGHIRAGRHRGIVLAPTGSGKTLIGTTIANGTVSRGGRVLILAHRVELIDQVSKKLDEIGLDHGVIQGDHWRSRVWCPVQVASVPTLARRERLPEANVVLVDEAHHSTSASFVSVISRYPDAYVIGLTATAGRLDGSGLGVSGPLGAVGYEYIVHVAHVDELIALGYLVPPSVFAPSRPDLSDVHSLGGEYKRDELALVMDRPKLTGNIVTTWQRMAAGRTTVGFAVNREHSRNLTKECRAAGIAAEHLDYETPADERRAILARVASGETTWLWNVDLVSEGWDLPRASCMVDASPTQSLGRWLQRCGRVLRPWEGKTSAVILDHAGDVYRHGLPTWRHEYSLEGSRKRKGAVVLSLRTCVKCFGVSPGSADRCELCDEPFPIRKQEIRTVDGELQEVTPAQRWAQGATDDARVKSLAKWMRIATEKKYKPTWPLVRYRALFHQWPGDAVQERAKEMANG